MAKIGLILDVDRMVMLEDVIDDGVSLVEALEIESKKTSSDRPSK